jgi:hypothetical protein
MSATAAQILIAARLVGATQVQGRITTAAQRIATPSALQTITAVGQAITAAAIHSFGLVASDANYTLTATPTIADAVADGEEITLLNPGAFTLTLQDEVTLPGSNLFLLSSTVSIGPKQIIRFIFSTLLGGWVQDGPVTGGTTTASDFVGNSWFFSQGT